MTLNSEESRRIRLVRSLAVGLIVFTHVSQEYGLGLEGWANVGVQVFLILSGFLMGLNPPAGGWGKWFRRRFARLVPAYYAILVLTALAYGLVLGTNIVDLRFLSHFTTLHFLMFPGEYPVWGGHLWYLTAAVLCYLIFPFLCGIRNIRSVRVLVFLFLLLPSGLAILCYKTAIPYRLSADIFAFVTGFALARLFGSQMPVFLTLGAACGGFLAVLLKESLFTPFLSYLGMPWIKTLLGVSFFLFFYMPMFNSVSHMAFVNFTDRYSYEIYLVHKNLILGPLSLLYLTPLSLANVAIAVGASVVMAVFLQKGTKAVSDAFLRKRS